MELTKIKGSTYYINAPTNIGVYTFKNKNCLVIDTGLHNGNARKIDEVLTSNGLHPKYIINTHSHLDHCGGNSYFQENYPGCVVYTSELEKIYMENPHLRPSMLFSSHPISELIKGSKSFNADVTLEPGINKINDEKFEIISLKGHSAGQIGIITPEKVCFLGDSLFSREVIEKYSLPYLYNIEEAITALKYIREVDADFFVTGHSSSFWTREEAAEIVDFNLSNIEKFIEQISVFLDQPLSKEDLLQNLIDYNELKLTFKQYHLYYSSVSAFLAYMFDKKMITYSIEDGKVYYYNL